MTLNDIASLRLLNQKLHATEFRTAKEVVSWMGAMQAQDYAMAKRAVGMRMLNSTDQIVEAALDRGEIIRTHLMRPTWHLVSADDIYWLLELTAPRIKASIKARHRNLEFTKAILAKSNALLLKMLGNEKNLPREVIAGELRKAGIKTDGNRLSHLLFVAELEGLVCSGKVLDGKLTYGLLQERVPQKKVMSREESLGELAKRYFNSHGPATLKDFTWWSGLPVAGAKQALELIQRDLFSEFVGPEQYWFAGAPSIGRPGKSSVHLLPAYDEFLISYRDRSAALSAVDNRKAVSDNGIFRPVVVVNGKVTGFWKRSTAKNNVILDINFFRHHGQAVVNLILKESVAYAGFLGKEAVTQIRQY